MEQLRKGYKITKVGIIPEDWNGTTLGNLLEFKNGLNKASEYFGFGTPIVNYMDVFKNTAITEVLVQGRVSLTRQEINNFSAKKGDVFFTRTSETQNEVGIAAVLLDEIPNCVFSGFVLRGRRKSGEIVEDYYKYCLQPQYVRSQIISSSSYTTRALTNGRNLSKVKLVFPPTLTEQKAIADALSDVDALITNLEMLITKKKAIKQGAMQQLLTPPQKGGKRLEGFSGEWKEVSIECICDCLDNLRVPLNEIERTKMKGDIPYCGANGVVDYINNYIIDDDIILIAEDGGYFDEYKTRPIAYRMKGKCWVNNHAHIIKAKNGISQAYIYYSLVNKNILDYINGGTRAKLNKSELYKIEIWMPVDFEEQNEVSTILEEMDNEIDALLHKLIKVQNFKQGMMQELLTGKTRLI